ncbi:MAG: SMP-30/gluconolactonase/LRE family protein [Acetobacteraceae bacterium]|nr:SMP-30/gluconolactonase/LRE family protein [Acetobacteraceae bacterium]
MKIEILLDAHATIGESPTWVSREQAIYWIDVKAPALHRIGINGGFGRTWRLPSDIGAFALIKGRPEALVALRHGLFRLNVGTEQLELLTPPPFDPSLHRFNEGACDSTGRFWVGTMFDPAEGGQHMPEPASLHSFTLAGGLQAEPDAAELHNGMAWSKDERTYYLSHTQRGTVYAFPFDPEMGTLGERRPFVTIPESVGVPDGAALDEDGCYWCAIHGGSRLHRYRPDGTLDREVMLPVSQPTMCAFAGADLETMVVTSATDGLTPAQRREQPHAGALLCFRPGVRGIQRHHTVR